MRSMKDISARLRRMQAISWLPDWKRRSLKISTVWPDDKVESVNTKVVYGI